MSLCSRCGKLNEPEAYFCQDCGTRLVDDPNSTQNMDLPLCPVCGKRNPEGTRFCHVCGVRLPVGSEPERVSKDETECPVCGKMTPCGFAFCQFCGNRIEGGHAVASESVPPTPPAGVRMGDLATPDAEVPAEVPVEVPAEVPADLYDEDEEITQETPMVPEPSPSQTAELTGLSVAVRKMAGSPDGQRDERSRGKVRSSRTGSYAASHPEVPKVVDKSAQVILVSIKRDRTEGERYAVDAVPFDIGRSDGQLTFADDGYLSPRHCRLTRTEGELQVVDLDSLNGVFVRIAAAEDIGDGDVFLIGAQVLQFEQLLPAEQEVDPAVQQGVKLFGSPVGKVWGRLKQSTTAGIIRDVVHLHQERVVFGRQHGDVIYGHDVLMSDRHAALARTGNGAALEDLGSSNGTFVRVRGRRKLRFGDTLRIGDQLLRVEAAEDGNS